MILAKKILHNKSLTDILYILFSQYFIVIISGLRGFIFAKLLGPYFLGINNSLLLIQQYGANSNLGLQQGLMKLFPKYRASNNFDKIELYKNQSFSLTIIFTTIITCIGLIFTWTYFSSYDLVYKVGASLYLLELVIFQYYIFLSGISKSLMRFKLASSAELVLVSSQVVLGIVLVYFYSIWGLFVTILLKYLFVFFIFKRCPEKFKLQYSFDKEILIDLFKNGLILTALNLILTFVYTLDRLFIIKFFTIELLGYYSLALTFGSLITQFTSSLSSFLYPKILARSGADPSLKSVKILSYKVVSIVTKLMPILIIICIIFVLLFVKFFLKEYEQSILPSIVLIVAVFFSGITSSLNSYYISKNGEFKLILYSILSSFVFVLFILFFKDKIVSLFQIALLSLLVRGVNSIFIVMGFLKDYVVGSPYNTLLLFLKIYFPFIFLLLTAIIVFLILSQYVFMDNCSLYLNTSFIVLLVYSPYIIIKRKYLLSFVS